MSETEAQDPETISLLAMFDELVRNEKVNYLQLFEEGTPSKSRLDNGIILFKSFIIIYQ